MLYVLIGNDIQSDKRPIGLWHLDLDLLSSKKLGKKMSQQIEGLPGYSPVKRSLRKKTSSNKSDSDADSINKNKNSSQRILSEEFASSSLISTDSSPKTRSGKQRLSGDSQVKTGRRKKTSSKKSDSDADSITENKNSSQQMLSEQFASSSPNSTDSSPKRRSGKQRQLVDAKTIDAFLGLSLKNTSGDSPVKSGIRKKTSSKKSDSDADSITENKNPSQRILFQESLPISKDSSPKSRSGKQIKSVGAKAKKRSLKLEEQDEKEPKKPKKYSRKSKTTRPSESPTKANASKRNLKTEKAPNDMMLKWLKSPSSTSKNKISPKRDFKNKSSEDQSPSENKPNTSKITSPKRGFKSKEDDALVSVTAKKVATESKPDKKRRRQHRTKKISPETVTSQETGFKSSKLILIDWLSPSTSKDISSKKSLEIIAPSSSEKKVQIKPKEHAKKQRKPEAVVKISQETVKTKENLSQDKMLKWLGSTSKKESIDLNKEKHATKSRKDKKKPPTKRTKPMSLKSLDNLSPDTVRNITMQDIFGPDTSPPKAPTTKRRLKKKPPTKRSKPMSLKTLENLSPDTVRKISMQDIFGPDTSPPPTTKRWLFKTAAKENISKTRKKPKKTPVVEVDDLPTFQTNLPEPSESFKKYGVVIPTVKEILAERKELLIYKALVDQAKIIPLAPNPFINLPKEPVKPPMKLLDCKHLSLGEIKEQFIKNKPILENIKTGKQYSEKHKEFHASSSSVPYNPSNLVFTYQQINCMANLMREELDPKEKHLRYTFAVLIPELCLLIFMDAHKMTKEETVKYLEECPID